MFTHTATIQQGRDNLEMLMRQGYQLQVSKSVAGPDGASYDLNEVGEWVPNQSNPSAQPNALNVGRNGYQTPVSIIVGVRNVYGGWQPIWVSTDMLLQNSNGEYEPLQTVQIWYEEDDKTSTMISSQKTSSQTFTYTDTTSEYFTYDTQAGVWQSPQPSPFNLESWE
ncbi:splicing factor 3b [Fusarium sporotrichioides]|uniref:Splicing factor 3b n=1 Tax=Fusarium sporotrichioides TaxID=5514 RepID=A0A395RUN3_FUSSP|nr:splicing factor 3b [Fusarium sporotrichioides]